MDLTSELLSSPDINADLEYGQFYHALIKSDVNLESRHHLHSLVSKTLSAKYLKLFTQSQRFLNIERNTQYLELSQRGYSCFHDQLPNYLSLLPLSELKHNEVHDLTHLFVNDDNILTLICDPSLHAIVWKYMDCPAMLTHVKVQYISGVVPNGNETCFHRDRDDFRQVKLFVYLSDVDVNCHPHEFISDTHLKQYSFELCNQKSSLSKKDRFFSDNSLNKSTEISASDCKKFIGPSGTHLLEDTYALHRRSPSCTGNRILLNLTWTITPNQRAEKLLSYNFPVDKTELPDFMKYSLCYISSW